MARTRRVFSLLNGLRAGVMAGAIVLAASPAVEACGPFIPRAVFTFIPHPDMPLEPYAAGKLGAVLPSYARSYLVVAYRYLSGVPLDGAEQQAVLALWSARLNSTWSGAPESPEGMALQAWQKARETVPGAGTAPDIQIDKEIAGSSYFATYQNCLANAFSTAAQTLSQRQTRLGGASAPVRDWLVGQDMVFTNCSAGPSIPAAAPAAADGLARADRAYQIAAASFYAGQFDAALADFRAIAADAGSPWRALAPYLMARTLVRKATLGAGEGKVDAKALAEADRQIGVVLADQSLSELHPAALRLRDFVRFRSEPNVRRTELAQALSAPKNGPEMRQRLADYTLLLDKLVADGSGDTTTSSGKGALPDRGEDITRWILTFQADDDDATETAVRAWRADGGLPWLFAAISKVEPAHSAVPDLLAAAAKLDPASPGWAGINYNAARLLDGRGEKDKSRGRIEAMLADHRAALPLGTVNLLLALRMPLADSLAAFGRDLQRTPVASSIDFDGTQLPDDVDGDAVTKGPREPRQPRIDEDGALSVNEFIPLSLRQRLVETDGLSDALRREFAVSGWVRAVVTKDPQAAAYALFASSRAPDVAGALNAYLSAAPSDRHYTAIYALLRNPGLTPFVDWGFGRTTAVGEIDEYRNNWWCKDDNEGTDESDVSPPAFLTQAERQSGQREWQAVASVPTGPNYLAAEAVAWALARPDDPRVPEALHLAVRATRFGCTDEATTGFSKRAFELLHRKYGKSEWAEKTKYYY